MQDNAYPNTIARLEPNIAMVDRDAALASIAVSLRRIADALTTKASTLKYYDINTDIMLPLTQEKFNEINRLAQRYDVRRILKDLEGSE